MMLGCMQEVRRIRSEHLDDPACIVNDRVKGSLKVTRAFGAGYLKEVCLHSNCQ
jgi:pyruvate dehydrogenase phosphatase